MKNMLSYVENCKFLTYVMNTQTRQQDLMSEEEDFKILHEVNLLGYQQDFKDIVEHRLVLDKMCNRYFLMTKIRWEKFRQNEMHK